jgi:hypothetical protein
MQAESLATAATAVAATAIAAGAATDPLPTHSFVGALNGDTMDPRGGREDAIHEMQLQFSNMDGIRYVDMVQVGQIGVALGM